MTKVQFTQHLYVRALRGSLLAFGLFFVSAFVQVQATLNSTVLNCMSVNVSSYYPVTVSYVSVGGNPATPGFRIALNNSSTDYQEFQSPPVVVNSSVPALQGSTPLSCTFVSFSNNVSIFSVCRPNILEGVVWSSSMGRYMPLMCTGIAAQAYLDLQSAAATVSATPRTYDLTVPFSLFGDTNSAVDVTAFGYYSMMSVSFAAAYLKKLYALSGGAYFSSLGFKVQSSYYNATNPIIQFVTMSALAPAAQLTTMTSLLSPMMQPWWAASSLACYFVTNNTGFSPTDIGIAPAAPSSTSDFSTKVFISKEHWSDSQYANIMQRFVDFTSQILSTLGSVYSPNTLPVIGYHGSQLNFSTNYLNNLYLQQNPNATVPVTSVSSSTTSSTTSTSASSSSSSSAAAATSSSSAAAATSSSSSSSSASTAAAGSTTSSGAASTATSPTSSSTQTTSSTLINMPTTLTLGSARANLASSDWIRRLLMILGVVVPLFVAPLL